MQCSRLFYVYPSPYILSLLHYHTNNNHYHHNSSSNAAELEELTNTIRALQTQLIESQIDLDAVRADRDAMLIELRSAKDQVCCCMGVCMGAWVYGCMNVF